MAKKQEKKEDAVLQDVHYYDPISKGFYSRFVHEDKVPKSAVALEDDYYRYLVEGLSDGKEIVMTGSGPKLADPEYTEVAKIQTLKLYRKDIERGGIQVQGIDVETDEKTELRIGAVVGLASSDKDFKISGWTTPSGIVDLTAPLIVSIANAMAAHFSACFAAENIVKERLSNYETADEIKAAFDVQYKHALA